MTVVQVPRARVALSTAAVYPQNCATAFDLAQRLGYDGVEVMVWNDPVSQEAGALKSLSDLHGQPIVSVHAPTLLLTQRVWGPDAWSKVDRSIELACAVGADTVVLHPPFRWQKEYARSFAEGVALREDDSGITLAVENMFPWRARTRFCTATWARLVSKTARPPAVCPPPLGIGWAARSATTTQMGVSTSS